MISVLFCNSALCNIPRGHRFQILCTLLIASDFSPHSCYYLHWYWVLINCVHILKLSFSLSSIFRLWFSIKLWCLIRVDFITVYERDLEDWPISNTVWKRNQIKIIVMYCNCFLPLKYNPILTTDTNSTFITQENLVIIKTVTSKSEIHRSCLLC